MKQKITFLMAMLCLMAVAMAAQPKQPQRACDVVKMQQQKGKKQLIAREKVDNTSFEVRQQDGFLIYTPQHTAIKAESENTDTATVTLKYNLDEEDFTNYVVGSIMIYNNQWSALWHPDRYMPDGSLVKGIIVKVPVGTYDVYTNSFYQPEQVFSVHIDELITIDNDVTINLDIKDPKILFSHLLYTEDGELLFPDTYRLLNEEPWFEVIEEGNVASGGGVAVLRLNGYGNVSELMFGSDMMFEGRHAPGSLYINNLSDRYQFWLHERTLSKTGMIYENKLCSSEAGVFPLKNAPSDYVACEEYIQRTPLGRAELEQTRATLWDHTFLDNSQEFSGDLTSHIPIGADGKVHAMINAPKTGFNGLEGVNVAVRLGVLDTERASIWGPMMLMRSDKSVEYLVKSDVMQTSEGGIWKDDYPAHPKFSYTYKQKRGIIGNNCPLVTFDSRNAWNQRRNANMIMMLASHVGRNGELIGSGDIYSTMTAKYNGEQIYSGKQALDSLRMSWVGVNPDGNYELEFTNANVAVDGIDGKNVTTVYFDQTKEDQNSPLLTMLQFRDGENNVTDRFDTPEGGVIMFAGGDFEPKTITYMTEYGYESSWNYKECQPMTVEVSYAPYGSDEWQPLEGVEHQAEYDDIPGLGFFYAGSLAGVNTPSENGWFDLKFRLVDEAGNWQEQTLSPAFRIDNLVQSAVTEVRDNDAHELARYSIDGKRVDDSHHGIVIVKMSDGTARKVLVP